MLRMAGERSGYASSSNESFVYEGEMDQLHDVEDVESQRGVEERHGNANVENEVRGDEEDDEEDDDDLFEMHGHVEIDPDEFESDEAYARALQDAEERELAVRLMAFTGIHECKKLSSSCYFSWFLVKEIAVPFLLIFLTAKLEPEKS